MPIYEYKCEVCGHQFDRMMKMSDPNPPCPDFGNVADHDFEGEGEPHACGGETKKLISGGTFHLKGGGWAADGY